MHKEGIVVIIVRFRVVVVGGVLVDEDECVKVQLTVDMAICRQEGSMSRTNSNISDVYLRDSSSSIDQIMPVLGIGAPVICHKSPTRGPNGYSSSCSLKVKVFTSKIVTVNRDGGDVFGTTDAETAAVAVAYRDTRKASSAHWLAVLCQGDM